MSPEVEEEYVIHLVKDIQFAVRRYRTVPGPTLAIILTLALGVGANTAIFSLVDGVWLRPLAITDPAHLLAITSLKGHATADSELLDTSSSYGEFTDIRERVPAFADVIGVDHRGVALETADGIQLLTAEVVTDNYFGFVGVHPVVGHLPNEAETRQAQTPFIAVSYGTWKRFFGGNPGVVGQPVKLKGGTAVVAAVLPSGFHGTERMMDPQVYVPRSTWMSWFPQEGTARTYRNFDVYARLRPGASLDQARTQLQSLSTDLASGYPEANQGRSFGAAWEAKGGNPIVKRLSVLLLAVGAAIVLIACTNIANLLLALQDGRRREIAMRAALGATRWELLRQLVTEYAVLAAVGVGVALTLAERLIALVPALIPDIGVAVGPDFRIDHRVLIFAVVVGALTVLLCGLLPALASTHASPIEAMRSQVIPGAKLRMPMRKIFVTAQIAASMALLIVTGLLVRALMHVESMDMGFNSHQNAVVAQLEVAQAGPAPLAESEALVGRMKALPGVKDATVSRIVPFALMGGGATKIVLAPGEVPSDAAGTAVWFNQVDNGYFRVMGVPILQGRAFGRQDTPASQRVIIVNQTLARRLFGTEEVLGKHLRIGRQPPIDAEIVGLAHNGKYADVGEDPQPYIYFPLAQDAWSDMALTVTTAGDPRILLPSVRKAVHEVNSDAMVLNTETLTDHMKVATYANRMAAGLTASLGVLALILTVIGLYGVIAYSVSRRTHEIGIRMALGARGAIIGAGVLGDGVRLVLIGMTAGAGVAVFAGRWISSLLYGVKPLDAVVFVSVAFVMLGVSVAALIAPTRRALHVDPAVALRDE